MGSSLFLRSVYGNGYYLTLVKDDWSGDSVDGEQQKKELNVIPQITLNFKIFYLELIF